MIQQPLPFCRNFCLSLGPTDVFPIFLFMCLGLLSASETSFANMQNVKSSQTKQIAQNAASQKKIDKSFDKKEAAIQDYRQTLQMIENQKIYNQQLRDFVESQNEEITSLKSQIDRIDQTNEAVVPLLVSMLDTLKEFVRLDMSFLDEERKKRLRDLTAMMKRADVSTSEKYRRIMEAYQIEAEYGRTIESYKEEISVSGSSRTVNVLRVGRLAVFAISLDHSESFRYNTQDKAWTSLDGEFASSILTGIKIAENKSAPTLLTLPLPTALGENRGGSNEGNKGGVE